MNRPYHVFAVLCAVFLTLCPSEGNPETKRNVIKSHPEIADQMQQALDTIRK